MVEQEISERDQQALEAAKGFIKMDGETKPAAPAAAAVPTTVPAKEKDTGKPALQQPGAGPEVKKLPDQPQKPVEVKPPLEVKTPLGTQTVGGPAGPVLSSWDDIKAFAKEQGVKLEEADDIRTVFTTISDLQKQVKSVPALENQVNTYKSQMAGLPVDVVNIMEAALANQDYRAVIKDLAAGVDVDLSRPFGEHRALELVRRYVDPGISQEKYDEMSDANKDAYSNLARTKYESDQTKWKTTQIDNTRSKQESQVNFDKSIQAALEALKKEFPGLTPDALNTVSQKMQFGLHDSLFNPDNTYKPDAGIKIAMQEYGQEIYKTQYATIGELAKKIGSQIEGKTNEALITRNDKPDAQGKRVSDDTNIVSDAVKQATHFLP